MKILSTNSVKNKEAYVLPGLYSVTIKGENFNPLVEVFEAEGNNELKNNDYTLNILRPVGGYKGAYTGSLYQTSTDTIFKVEVTPQRIGPSAYSRPFHPSNPGVYEIDFVNHETLEEVTTRVSLLNTFDNTLVGNGFTITSLSGPVRVDSRLESHDFTDGVDVTVTRALRISG